MDLIEDMEGVPKFVYHVMNSDGIVREIDFGGKFCPGMSGKRVLFNVHDESCFDAGEQQTHGWLVKGVQICMD